MNVDKRPGRNARSDRKPLKIGITIGLREPGESLWINGIKQNALYLARLFLRSPQGHSVCLVNTTGVSLTSGLPWDTREIPVCTFEEAKDQLDVLIELGGQVGAEATRHLHSRGTRLVSYCCGDEYVHNMQAMIFGRPLHRDLFINQEYDAVWAIPQVMTDSAAFFGTLRRRPVQEVPFVWDPMCLEERCRSLGRDGYYQPREVAKRISIMEPNHDVSKFCLYPVFVAEHAYRASPDSICHVHVTNAEYLAVNSPEFAGVVRYLDLVRNGKISFVGRYDTPHFLSEFTDIVISHQWSLPLNYFYLDVCWLGYPLVHNGSLCKELGYYYPDNDVEAGANRVLEAVREHDRAYEDYRLQQQRLISRFLSSNVELAQAYDTLLYGLFSKEN